MEISNLLVQLFLNIINQKLVLGLLILCALFILFSILLKFIKKASTYKYRSIGTLFSSAEQSFFLVLKQSLSDNYEVFAKVRIADVLLPEKGLSRKNWNTAFYRISSKHFDYVLCDKKTLSVVAVIELDDKSHNQREVRRRDAFVEKACVSADLKLLRFKCRSSYEFQFVRETVLNSLNM